MTPKPDSWRIYYNFGSQNAFQRTGTNLVNAPMWLSYKLHSRTGEVIAYLVGVAYQTGDEVGDTAGNLVGILGYLIDDSAHHLPPLAETWRISFAGTMAQDFWDTVETIGSWPGG